MHEGCVALWNSLGVRKMEESAVWEVYNLKKTIDLSKQKNDDEGKRQKNLLYHNDPRNVNQ